MQTSQSAADEKRRWTVFVADGGSVSWSSDKDLSDLMQQARNVTGLADIMPLVQMMPLVKDDTPCRDDALCRSCSVFALSQLK